MFYAFYSQKSSKSLKHTYKKTKYNLNLKLHSQIIWISGYVIVSTSSFIMPEEAHTLSSHSEVYFKIYLCSKQFNEIATFLNMHLCY